jgi:hypothetical protein
MLNKKKVFKIATLARCWRVFSPHSHLLDANISNGMLTVNRRFLVRHVGFLCTIFPLYYVSFVGFNMSFSFVDLHMLFPSSLIVIYKEY